MSDLFSLSALISLLTLTVMEIVLGIDNIIFVSIVAGKLPVENQKKARFTGLLMAMFIRVCLLFLLTWIKEQSNPLFSVAGHGVSARDIILCSGGLFLMTKSTREIHHRLEGKDEVAHAKKASMASVIFQIVILDVVFSFDSILTAIGIADEVGVMIGAVILSMIIMMLFAGRVSDFVNRHPTVKMLALSFLLMIGFLLVVDGLPDTLGIHVPKGYLYFAMAFSLFVEVLNMKAKKNARKPVKLREDVPDPLE